MEEFKEQFLISEDGNPICREERQYAVFLYNILKYYGKRAEVKLGNSYSEVLSYIFKKLGLLDAKVEAVYYEATFMRDLHKIDKKAFNERLYEFVLKEFEIKKIPDAFIENDSLKEYNLGARVAQQYFNENPQMGSLFRVLMNCKPDIAVVYTTKEERYLKFIECKYESKEKIYKLDEKNIIKQVDAQKKILKYLIDYEPFFNNKKIKYGDVIEFNFKKEHSSVVNDLYRLNEEIFKK